MEYGSLYELIGQLTFGTKLHIGALFFGNRSHPLLALPQQNQIHASPVCDFCKSTPEGMRRCVRCRNAAIKRALVRKKAFAAPCINGVFEYTRPVVMDGQVACVVYVGNMIPPEDCETQISSILEKETELLHTLQKGVTLQQCETIGKLLESYIRMIWMTCPIPAEEAALDPLIENIKAFLDANLEHDITLQQLAELFHYSGKYLGRLFKSRCGKTVKEYLNTRRLEQAGRLLAQTDKSVVDISFRVGFNQVTYFDRLFRRYYGLTPSEYRLRIRQSSVDNQ